MSTSSTTSDPFDQSVTDATNSFNQSYKNATSTFNTYVAISVVLSVLFIAVIGFLIYRCLKVYEKQSHNPVLHIGPSTTIQQAPPYHNSQGNISLNIEVQERLRQLHFSFEDVREMTSNFRVKLGVGGFGAVYYGKLKNGKAVAVKRLSDTSGQGMPEFLNEVEILSRAHHKNLVSLVGYCCETNEKCLIYEFVENGTLDDHLHGLPSEKNPLDWLSRLKIAIGAAKGFTYLHNDCDPPIIHRDVKSNNILLDEKFMAKVADFGLSKILTTPSMTHITTGVKGTWGYLDPEYAQMERLTEKSDVYSFGIILLELISGRKAIIQKDEDHIHIAQWATPYIQSGRITYVIDNRLGNTYCPESIQHVANIALKCVERKSMLRPTFNEVLSALEVALKCQLPTNEVSGSISSESSNSNTVIPIIGIESNDYETLPLRSNHTY